MNENKIQIPQKLQKRMIFKKLLQTPTLKKQAVMAPNQKKTKNSATKPTFLTKEGTMYKLISTITCDKDHLHYIETKTSHNKDDQDTCSQN